MRSTFVKRGLWIRRFSQNPHVIPRSETRRTPANRTLTMNPTPVFVGAKSKGPHLRVSLTNASKSSRARGPFPSRKPSTVQGPQECHMLRPTKRAPHRGHTHIGRSSGDLPLVGLAREAMTATVHAGVPRLLGFGRGGPPATHLPSPHTPLGRPAPRARRGPPAPGDGRTSRGPRHGPDLLPVARRSHRAVPIRRPGPPAL